MLSRLLGRKKRRGGEQQELAGAMYQLDRVRRIQLYIPYLKRRIGELEDGIAQKGS